jgi:alkylation response protein AidB-like acyl-CoA dehydrogenase
MGTLAFERVAIATGRVNTTGAVNDLIRQIAASSTDDGTPLGAQPLVRQRIADLYGRALVHYLIGQRVITGAAGDGPPGPVTSIGKLYFCPLVEDIADFGLELDDMGGQFALAEKSTADSEPNSQQRWLRLAYQARGTAIAGGSTFIQRNIAAERILGMPRD